jgi:cobalt-zinc-cadmium efflux system protein
MAPAAQPTHAGRHRRVLIALVFNVAIVAVELAGGVLAHSTALFADAGHNLADVASLVFALVALRFALRAPTASRSYGYHRATILSALANVALLFALTTLIVAGAVLRLLHPTAVHGGTVAVIGAIALVCNGIGAALVFERGQDLQMRSLLVHLGGDALASVGVILVGIVVMTTGHFSILDPVISLLISALILFQGVGVARESVAVLLEGAPRDIDPARLAGAITGVEGVDSVHDLHCWSLSSELRAVSAHIVLQGHPSLEEAQLVGGAVKSAIAVPFGLAHATLELECEPCGEEDTLICTIGFADVH